MISKEVLAKYSILPDYSSIECKEIDDSTYFGPNYKNFISNSKLKLINPEEGGSFLTYLKGLQQTTTSSLTRGSAVHQILLQEEEFIISNQTKPSAKAGQMIDKIFQYRNMLDSEGKACYSIYQSLIFASEDVDYYKDQLTKARVKTLLRSGLDYYMYLHRNKNKVFKQTPIVLDKTSRSVALACIESVRRNMDAMDLLRPDEFSLDNIVNRNEDALIMDIIVSFPNSLTDPNAEYVSQPLKLKIKIDNWNVNLTDKVIRLNDLKTSGKKLYMFPGSTVAETGEFLEGSFQHYRYYRQMAFYWWILSHYISKKFRIENMKESYRAYLNMIVVSTVPPYNCSVFRVDRKWLLKGFEEFSLLLKYAAFAEYNRDRILNGEI